MPQRKNHEQSPQSQDSAPQSGTPQAEKFEVDRELQQRDVASFMIDPLQDIYRFSDPAARGSILEKFDGARETLDIAKVMRNGYVPEHAERALGYYMRAQAEDVTHSAFLNLEALETPQAGKTEDEQDPSEAVAAHVAEVIDVVRSKIDNQKEYNDEKKRLEKQLENLEKFKKLYEDGENEEPGSGNQAKEFAKVFYKRRKIEKNASHFPTDETLQKRIDQVAEEYDAAKEALIEKGLKYNVQVIAKNAILEHAGEAYRVEPATSSVAMNPQFEYRAPSKRGRGSSKEKKQPVVEAKTEKSDQTKTTLVTHTKTTQNSANKTSSSKNSEKAKNNQAKQPVELINEQPGQAGEQLDLFDDFDNDDEQIPAGTFHTGSPQSPQASPTPQQHPRVLPGPSNQQAGTTQQGSHAQTAAQQPPQGPGGNQPPQPPQGPGGQPPVGGNAAPQPSRGGNYKQEINNELKHIGSALALEKSKIFRHSKLGRAVVGLASGVGLGALFGNPVEDAERLRRLEQRHDWLVKQKFGLENEAFLQDMSIDADRKVAKSADAIFLAQEELRKETAEQMRNKRIAKIAKWFEGSKKRKLALYLPAIGLIPWTGFASLSIAAGVHMAAKHDSKTRGLRETIEKTDSDEIRRRMLRSIGRGSRDYFGDAQKFSKQKFDEEISRERWKRGLSLAIGATAVGAYYGASAAYGGWDGVFDHGASSAGSWYNNSWSPFWEEHGRGALEFLAGKGGGRIV